MTIARKYLLMTCLYDDKKPLVLKNDLGFKRFGTLFWVGLSNLGEVPLLDLSTF